MFSFSSLAGHWKNNYGNWYYIEDSGNLATNKWVGNYYLGADGVMMTNSWTPDGYYVGEDGSLVENKIDAQSTSFVTESGVYRGFPYETYVILGEGAPELSYMSINGDVLTVIGSLDYYQSPVNNWWEYETSATRLPEGTYSFQLNYGTEYYDEQDQKYLIDKSEFQQYLQVGEYRTVLEITVNNGIVTSLVFSGSSSSPRALYGG